MTAPQPEFESDPEPDERVAPDGDPAVHLQRLREDDAKLVFGIRHTPDILAEAGNSRPVSWESHLEWFRHAVRDPDRMWWKILIGKEVGGLLRFDRIDDQSWQVSIALLSQMRRRGVARSAHSQGLAQLFETHSKSQEVRASIRGTNTASLKHCRALGYTDSSVQSEADMVQLSYFRRTERFGP